MRDDHLSLEALLLVLHNMKVSQVQVGVVSLWTVCRGHVPHQDERLVLQDGMSCSHSLQRGVDEGIRLGGILWQRVAMEGRDEEDGEEEERQLHGCSPTDVSFLAGERNRPDELFCI